VAKTPKKPTSRSTKAKAEPDTPASAPLPAPSPRASTEIPFTVTMNGQPGATMVTVTSVLSVTVTAATSPTPTAPTLRRSAQSGVLVVVPAIVGIIEVRGGKNIVCNEEQGTVTIACFQGTSGVRTPVLLTAGHVVGGAAGVGATVTLRGSPVGIVSEVGASQDFAVVELDPSAIAVFEVEDEQTSTIIAPFNFSTRAKAGELIMVGSVSGRVTGTLIRSNASITLDDKLSGKTGRSLQGLFEIQPQSGPSFGLHGDSGSPVLQTDENGDTNIVGLLVAVDESTGFGYAEHFGGSTGLTAKLNLHGTE